MNRHFTVSFILIFTIFFLITACKQSVSSLIDDYNSNFSEYEEVLEAPCPGDDDFKPGDMLDDEYFVWEDSTLNLCAPNKCTKYSWIITDPEDDSVIPIHHYMYASNNYTDEWTLQDFYISIPDSGLKTDKVYKLTLTVLSEEGDSYTDTAAIVIYQHLYL